MIREQDFQKLRGNSDSNDVAMLADALYRATERTNIVVTEAEALLRAEAAKRYALMRLGVTALFMGAATVLSFHHQIGVWLT